MNILILPLIFWTLPLGAPQEPQKQNQILQILQNTEEPKLNFSQKENAPRQ